VPYDNERKLADEIRKEEERKSQEAGRMIAQNMSGGKGVKYPFGPQPLEEGESAEWER
jgi:hypothetical protein